MEAAFNFRLLQIARQFRGLSQQELAASAGVSQPMLSKIENGLAEPPEGWLEKVAGALQVPVSFFYQPDRIYGLPMSVHPMFRKRASVGQRMLEQLQAELNVRVIHIRRLLRSIEFKPELQLPHMEPTEFGGPDGVAEKVRRAWLVPMGPIRSLVEYAERAGCLVMLCEFQHAGVDGISLRLPDVPPCIFLNKRQPVDRLRFSLAHELGHLVMHDVPSETMEDEANAFASALLMPAPEIRRELMGPLSLNRLATLKPIWRVSMQALLYRAKTVGAISDSKSSYLWRQLSSMGMRTSEPVELDPKPDEPKVFSEIFRAHMEDLGYALGQLMEMLHVYEADVRHLYGLESSTKRAGHLRLIKN